MVESQHWRALHHLVVTTLSILAVPSSASVNLSLSHDKAFPSYFSGTSCRIEGWAQIAAGSPGIQSATLKVGGQQVASYQGSESAPEGTLVGNAAGMHWKVMFDSTHFVTDTMLSVSPTVTEYGGTVYSLNQSAIVINRMHLFGRYDLEVEPVTWNFDANDWTYGNNSWGAIDVVLDRLGWSGYALGEYQTGMGWNHSPLLASVGPGTALWVNTHGAVDFFWTDHNDYNGQLDAEPPQAPAERILGSEVPPVYPPLSYALLPYRTAGHGSGTPPYNTGGPPIRIAFIEACFTGSTNSFAEGLLYPYVNAYNWKFCENQAEVGYIVMAHANSTREANIAFWDALYEGYTVDEARDALFSAYDSGHRPQYPEQLLAVWGDHDARVHGVYTGTGNGDPVTAWFREGW